MIWLGLLWMGFGTADATHALTHRHWVPPLTALVVVLTASSLAGRLGGVDLILSLAIATIAAGWAPIVRTGFSRARPALPLTYAAVAGAVMVALNAASEGEGGALSDWLQASNVGYLQALTSDRFVFLIGAALIQGSTGNVLVRLVLLATHTVRPAQAEAPEPGPRLKGGRLLGPMERLIILGLGLTGSYTAIGIIVAAKGLLRFPELQAAREARHGPSIADVTEYFLVGNFLSWSLALGTLGLLAA